MLKQNRFGGLPNGEIRYQNTLLAFNTGTKWNLSFWFIIIAAFIVEIVLIRSAVDGRNAERFVNQKDYRISACEVEEIDEFYYLHVTYENKRNTEIFVNMDSNENLEYLEQFINAKDNTHIHKVWLPPHSEATATYRIRKEAIGEEGLILKIKDSYKKQEWKVELKD